MFLNAWPERALSSKTIGSPLLVETVIPLSSGTTPNNLTDKVSIISETSSISPLFVIS